MIRLILSPARAGGTLLNRCLGSFPNVKVVSEINPKGGGWGKRKENSFTTISSQMQNWYKIKIEPSDFFQEAADLISYSKIQNEEVIFRDWSHIDFWKNTIIDPPPNNFTIIEGFKKRFNEEIKPLAIIRNPIDTWISIGMPEPNQYFRSYHIFLKRVIEEGCFIVKYEDFVKDPIHKMKEITEFFGIPFYPDFISEFGNFSFVNGDSQVSRENTKFFQSIIGTSKRKAINIYRLILLKRAKVDTELWTRFEYETEYFNGDLGIGNVITATIKSFRRRF